MLTSITQTIGQYFGVVSFVPSSFLVLWIYALLAGRGPDGRWALTQLGPAFEVTAQHIAGLVLGAILGGLVLHPLQFGTTQLLEGYWGSGRLAVAVGAPLARLHRGRVRALEHLVQSERDSVAAGIARLYSVAPERVQDAATGHLTEFALRKLDAGRSDELIGPLLRSREAGRKLAAYPRSANRIMPTRLGNALRRFEDAAGSSYGIDGIATAPHFSLVSKPNHIDYVRDAQQSMDVSIRLWLVGVIAAAASVGLLLTDGLWLLVALLPLTLAYIAYRGAVSGAHAYGTAVLTMIDLNRFALYEALELRRPFDLAAEKRQNEALMKVLGGRDAALAFRVGPARP